MGIEKHKQFIKEKWAPAAGNVDAMMDCLTDDATYTLIGTTPISGTYDKAGFRELYTWVHANVPVPQGAPPQPELTVLGEGDAVALMVHFGEPVNNDVCQFIRFGTNGKIQKITAFADTEWVTRLWTKSGSDFHPRRNREWFPMIKQADTQRFEPSRADFDPLSSEATNEPFSLFARLRDETPVFFSPIANMWIVSRYSDILTVMGDTARFHIAGGIPFERTLPPELAGIVPEGFHDFPPIGDQDPQAHRRARRLANPVFRPAKINARANEVREVADRLIDDFVRDGRTDIFANLAVPLPLAIIARILGIADTDVGLLKRFTEITFISSRVTERDSAVSLWRQDIEFYRYIETLIDERRANPREGDLMTELICARDNETPPFTTRELVPFIRVLIAAGNETTRMLIGTLILRLLQHPDQLVAVRADPSLIEAAVEETIRHSGPAKGMLRITAEDVQLAGVTIPKGQLLQILNASANRDGAEFQHPDEFDLHRNDVTKHIGFGKGIHFCIGAGVARLEARIALEQVLTRLPGLRLASAEAPQWTRSIVGYGLTRLDVEWDV